MPEYEIAGVKVQFPYQAYGSQIAYMAQVIMCLKEGANALLESPTGTGKTLCLLCATLAYRNHILATRLIANENSFRDEMVSCTIPKIIYASRTHSQLTQVISELRKTAYKPRTCILGSRDQMCRNPDVMKLTSNAAKTSRCRDKVKHRKCEYHSRVNEASKSAIFQESVMDIEDLIQLADNFHACAYYIARETLDTRDLIFVPYNYLIDPNTRKSQGIDLADSIVLIDEAHNLEGCATDAYSFTLSSIDIDKAVKDCCSASVLPFSSDVFNSSNVAAPVVDINATKQSLQSLQTKLENLVFSSTTPNSIKSGDYFVQLMKDVDITPENYSTHLDSIEEVTKRLFESKGQESPGISLTSIASIIRLIFSPENAVMGRTSDAAFKFVLEKNVEVSSSSSNYNIPRWHLNYWCFDPGLAMRSLKSNGASSIILTSGTLSPLDSLAKELALPFKFRFENTHVISASQVLLGIVSKGPMGKLLDSSYQNRNSTDYVLELGAAIVNATRIVPQGVLVFFPSYFLLNSCLTSWKVSRLGASTVMDTILKYKDVFVEPKDKDAFIHVMSDYCKSAGSRGALLFAVSRGKISEGIDFSDSKARAVIIVGIPYPSVKDPKIELKKAYLDECVKAKSGFLSGSDWYFHQALRAVNQAIGRVIRHKDDFGSIILFDHRYSRENILKHLPAWTKNSRKIFNVYGELQKAVVEFYKRQNLVIPMKSIAARPSISISEENFTTKNYLLAIKEALDSSKYTLFTKSLMNFSERKISALEMIHNVHEAIFSESTVLVPLETRRTLFLLFKHFLPSKYHQNHSELIKSLYLISACKKIERPCGSKMSCCTKPRSFHALSSRFSYFEERKFFCKGSTFIYLKVSDLILNESIIQEDEEAMETFRSVIKEYNSFQAFENPLNTAASTTDHCVVFPLNLHIFSANLFRKEDFVNIDRFLMALENGFLEFPHGKASSFRPSNEYFSTTNSIRKTGIPITESTAKSLTVKKEFIDELSTICKQYLNSDDFTAMTALLKSGRLDRLLLALGKYSNLGILSEKILRYLLKFLKNPVHLNCTSKATKHISSQAWNSLLCNIISELPAFAAIRTLYIILLMKYRSNCQLMDVDRKLSRVESERRLTTAETERRLSTWVTIGNMVFKECRNVNALIIFMMSKNIPLSMNSIEKLFIQFITYYPRKSVEAHLLQEVLKQPNIHRDHPYNESPFSIFEGYYKERLFHSPASIPVNIYNVMLVQSFWVSSRERLDYFCKMMVQTNKMNPFAHLIMLLYAYESRAENNDLKLKFQVFFNSLVEEKKKKLEFISDNDNLLIIPFFLERLLSVVEHLGLSDWNQKLAELLPPYSSIINERSSG